MIKRESALNTGGSLASFPETLSTSRFPNNQSREETTKTLDRATSREMRSSVWCVQDEKREKDTVVPNAAVTNAACRSPRRRRLLVAQTNHAPFERSLFSLPCVHVYETWAVRKSRSVSLSGERATERALWCGGENLLPNCLLNQWKLALGGAVRRSEAKTCGSGLRWTCPLPESIPIVLRFALNGQGVSSLTESFQSPIRTRVF